MLTISSHKEPLYYLRFIKYHFEVNSDRLLMQALGKSSANLVEIA